MPFPIQPISDRISYLLDHDLDYSPPDEFMLTDKLRNLEWDFLGGPMFISFTPLNSTKIIEVKGILYYSEAYKPREKSKNLAVNVIFLQFKGGKLIKLNGDKEEEIQLDNSNVFMMDNEVYTSLFLFDGTRKEVAKLNQKVSGTLNRFGSLRAYESEIKFK